MKYDSGMTHLNKDILAAVRLMCGSDTEITEKFSPNDGSPAPLRDYLKKKYSKKGGGFGSVHYLGYASKLDILLNKPIPDSNNDNYLTLSWSQVTNFIRNNWDNVFRKETAENQPSPAAEEPAEADKPKPTYKDVLLEHYPNFDVSRFEEFANYVCVACHFMDNGTTCTFEDGCEKHWESECLFEWRDNPKPLDSDYIEEFLVPANEKEETANTPELPKKMSKMCQELLDSNADTDTKTADLPNPPVPANAEEIASTFNYAVLSTEMGDYLKHKEQQLKNEYMNFTANCGAIFAEAQERLAVAGRYNNGVFVKWIESMGFKKDTVYRMINVHKFYLSQIAKDKTSAEIFEALPQMLQYDISKPSAPPELVEQVLNGDITTHSEYIKIKKELERTQEECRQIDANSAAKDKEYQRELDEANKRAETERKARESLYENYTGLQEGYKEFKDKYTEEYYKNVELKKRIGELKKQPVDVVVQQDEKALAEKEAEIQRLKNELEELSQRQSCSLDDCFEKPGEISTGEILEFYETLQANAISAIKECARFIKDKIPNNLQGDAKSRFKMLEELLADCKEEMEE